MSKKKIEFIPSTIELSESCKKEGYYEMFGESFVNGKSIGSSYAYLSKEEMDDIYPTIQLSIRRKETEIKQIVS